MLSNTKRWSYVRGLFLACLLANLSGCIVHTHEHFGRHGERHEHRH